MKSSVKFILALAMMLACFAIESAHPQITQTKQDSNTITVSGGSFRLDNKIGTVTNAFEDVIQGAPSTVSVVIKGCMRGADALGLAATCDTLDTYTTVANSIRKPTISVAYDYFLVTASWTGGASPSVGVYRMGTIARNGGGGAGGAVTSVFSLTGAVPDLTGDVTTGGSTATTLKNTGTSGTYQQVTTDAQGRVTAGVTRTVATSAPLGGGGALTSDLTLTCATCALTSATLAQFAATSSAQFFGNINDETGGTGLVVGNQSPTIVTPTIASFVNANHNHSAGAGGGVLALGTAVPNLSGAVVTSNSSATTAGVVDVVDASRFCSAAGANTTTYTCNLAPAPSGYVTGTHYRFKADVANTAASTINFNSLGAKTIKKAAGGITTDVAANDLRAGQWVEVVYDGTNMQMQSTLGNASAGGFTAPDGWTVDAGGMTAGTSDLLNTITRTCGGVTSCGIMSTLFNITSGSGKDVRLNQFASGTLSGNAGSGDTWAAFYNQMTFNQNNAAGALGHGLFNVERLIMTSTAGSNVALFANQYYTLGLTNLNGTTGAIDGVHIEYDASPSGTGTITQINTLSVGLPPAITGSPTVTNLTGIVVGDISPSTVPGTAKAGIAIGGPNSGSSKVPLYVTASTPANLTNMAVFGSGAQVQFGDKVEISSDVNTISSASASTKLQLTKNGGDVCESWYNGSVTFEECITGSNFTLSRGNGGTNAMTVDSSTAAVYLPQNRAFVASDFTTAANTNLQNITGLAFTLPASLATNVSFDCYVQYSQATAAVAVSFGVSASVAPTQINASGEIFTSSSVHTAGNLQGLNTTTATAIMTGTPSATATIFNANFRGMIENPSTTASTINFMVKTATSGDAVTVKRGSYCVLGS